MCAAFLLPSGGVCLSGWLAGLADRAWRASDLKWRVEERAWRTEERAFREEQRRWHRTEVTQRGLDNARYTWERHVEKNRRDVEERTEQLKVVSQVSALLAGFAVIALAEFEIEEEVRDREFLIAIFGISTGVIVSLMTLSTVICTYMLAGILRVGKAFVSLQQEERFLFACRAFLEEGAAHGDLPPVPPRTFERHWELRCEPDWQLAFSMFAAGLPLFLANVGLLAWLKFHFSVATAACITVVATIAVLLWLRIHLRWGALLREPTETLYRGGGRAAVSAADYGRSLPWDWCVDEYSEVRQRGWSVHSASPRSADDERPSVDERPAVERPTTPPSAAMARVVDASEVQMVDAQGVSQVVKVGAARKLAV